MKRVKKYWMVVLLGGLLMATLVGVAGARPNDRPMAALSRRITIPAGHFIPHDDDDLYENSGYKIESGTDASSEYFVAPVVFPTGQAVVVESITLYAYDGHGSYDMCLTLYRTDPTAGTQADMANVCSSDMSTTDPRSFTDSSIDNNPVKHGKGVYLWLDIEDDTVMRFYGARIEYHHGTT
jgi:hypothetical protein